MKGSKTDEVTEERFESLLQRYQKELEESWEEMNLFSIILIDCITILIK